MSDVKFLQITLSDDRYTRLNHYARYMMDKRMTAPELANRIINEWVERETDPVLVHRSILQMVKDMVDKCMGRGL